ncbi:hypothetical protein ACTMS0_28635 [Micromonospora sp. H33]|uniref:hypothetical protein n=1 Tax=Micromonospora sp. H33 TaxID=3452215 RepID=UPI003F896B3D
MRDEELLDIAGGILVVGRIRVLVDNQYRNHRVTVHDRPACSSRDNASNSSRARRAAACDG